MTNPTAVMELERPVEAVRSVVDTGAIEPALPGVSAVELAAAWATCRDVTRTRARNFYYGLRLTPEPRRSAIYSVYAWMRGADDAVDDAGTAEARSARLAEYHRVSSEILSGERPGREVAKLGPLWVAFAATARSYPIDHAIFHDMVEGLRADLVGETFQTDEQLARYCYCVAGTAGLSCLSIWGLRPGTDLGRAERLAVHRGQAFQRTNILRDLAQDFDEQPPRVYVPVEFWKRHGVTPAEVRAWSRPEACEALLREQIGITRGHYAASAGLEELIDPACAPTLWAMTRIYSALLDRIEADPRRIVSNARVRLPSVRKASIALSATIKSRLGRW